VNSGNEVLRPRLNDDERLDKNGDAQQSEHATDRVIQGTTPCLRSGAMHAIRCDVETHAASGR
jgi:hypothetical protein